MSRVGILEHGGKRKTGIAVYRDELTRAAVELAPEGVCVESVETAKRELQLGSLRVGGYVSQLVGLALGAGVERERLDVLHAPNFMQLTGDTTSLFVHDVIPWTHARGWGAGSKPFRWRARRALPDLESVLTPTRYVRDRLCELVDGLSREDVTVAPHGVSTEAFYPDPALNLGMGVDALMVGDVRPRKASIEQLEGLAAFARGSDLPVRLHRVGPPAGGSEKGYAQRFHRLATDLECVEYAPHGYQPEAILREFYSSCDVLLFASRDEGFGLPPLEAAACGTPSVVSRHPVFKETMGSAAPRVNVDEPESVAKGIGEAVLYRYPESMLLRLASGFGWEESARRHLEAWGVAP